MESKADVAIVFDPDYGNELVALANQMAVWVIDSAANRPVADKLWSDHPPDGRLTTFTESSVQSPENVTMRLLVDVDLHHPDWTTIDVIGCAPNQAISQFVQELGGDLMLIDRRSFLVTRKAKSPDAETRDRL